MTWRARFFIVLLAALLVAGCSGGTTGGGSGRGSGTFPLETLTVPVLAATERILETASGHRVDVPPEALSRDANLTLTVLSQAPSQPRNPDFEAPGQYLALHLNGARLSGPVTLEVRYSGGDPQVHYLQW